MACRLRGNAEEVKNDEGMDRSMLFRAQKLESGSWFRNSVSVVFMVRGAAAHAIPLSSNCGIQVENARGGRFSLPNSSLATLFFPPGFSGNMVQPRQRLLSRRSTSRGGSSRPSEASAQSRCCRCLCHRVAEAHPIRASQSLDPSSPELDSAPLPAFGMAVFSFNSTQENPRINAHVSVLFLEEPKDESEDHPSKKKHQAGSSREAEGPPEAAPEQAASPPLSQAVPSTAEDKKEQDPLPEDYGWCPIVEEELED